MDFRDFYAIYTPKNKDSLARILAGIGFQGFHLI
jgi:hypothetical protein